MAKRLKFQSRAGGHYSPAPPKPRAKARVKKETKASKVSGEAREFEEIKAKKETKEGGDR